MAEQPGAPVRRRVDVDRLVPYEPALRYVRITVAATGVGFAWVCAWSVQYLIAVPTVWLYRIAVAVIKVTLAVGGVAVVLLFIPVIGWALLVLLLILRHHERVMAQLAQPVEVTPGRSLLRPWWLDGGIALIRRSARSAAAGGS